MNVVKEKNGAISVLDEKGALLFCIVQFRLIVVLENSWRFRASKTIEIIFNRIV